MCNESTRVSARLDSLIEGIEKKAYIVNQFRAKFVKRFTALSSTATSVKATCLSEAQQISASMSGDVNADILSDENHHLIHDHPITKYSGEGKGFVRLRIRWS
jgi:hypothetical protein